MISEWLKRTGLLAVMLALSSCYIPDKFKSELRISRFGDYSLTFKGDLLPPSSCMKGITIHPSVGIPHVSLTFCSAVSPPDRSEIAPYESLARFGGVLPALTTIPR